MEEGEWYGGELAPAQASLDLTAEDNVRRVSPLPPHDELSLSAEIEHPDGRTYEVVATQPLVGDPAGRHTTWWGVGLDVWHHGETGIGTDRIPAVDAEVAVFGIGEIRVDGRPIAANVPVHVMTGSGNEFGGRLELDVGDPSALVPGIPAGHIRVIWAEYDGGGDTAHAGPYAVGLVVLAGLLIATLWASTTEGLPVPRRA